MSENKDVSQKQKEFKKQEISGKGKSLDQSDQKVQDVTQNQENDQSQDQEAKISQDINEDQVQKDLKSLNLLINSDALLPDLTSGVLKGIVMEDNSNESIRNAKISLFFGAQGRVPVLETETNSFGEFKLEDLPAGFYTLKITKNSYVPKSLYNFRVRAGQEVKAEIGLNRNQGLTFQSVNDKNIQDVDQNQINKQNQNQISTLTQDVKLQQKQIFNPTVNISIITGGSDLRDLTVGKIKGTILSQDSGLALTNTEVELYFGSDTQIPIIRQVTDEAGKYTFEDVPSGFYSVKVLSLSRNDKEALNLRVRPGKESRQDFTV